MDPRDQADVLAANERLTADLEAAVRDRDETRASLSALTTERDSALRDRDEARTSLTAVTEERDRLAGIDRDFNRRLAAEVAKHGIRADAIAPGSKAPAAIDLLAQYQAITDPKEKASFLAKHEKELRALVA